MKVTLNLASLPSRRERYALSWAIPLTLAGAVGFAFIIYFGIANIREYRQVQRDILHMQDQNQTLSRQGADLRRQAQQPDYQAVAGEAHYLNSLIEAKKSSVADLVAKVGQLMPDDVRLSNMSMGNVRGAQVSFSVIGKDEEALEKFLTALEDSPDFQDVSVSNEGFQGQGESEGAVSITCTARYVGSLVP
ncbi:MAG: PilN domain-containing protein [Deltaproteobacteria bacterium]